MHGCKVRWSGQALGLRGCEAQSMSGIKKGEQLGQSLDSRLVAVIGDTGVGVIGKAYVNILKRLSV
jgi:hypothetical protein